MTPEEIAQADLELGEDVRRIGYAISERFNSTEDGLPRTGFFLAVFPLDPVFDSEDGYYTVHMTSNAASQDSIADILRVLLMQCERHASGHAPGHA